LLESLSLILGSRGWASGSRQRQRQRQRQRNAAINRWSSHGSGRLSLSSRFLLRLGKERSEPRRLSSGLGLAGGDGLLGLVSDWRVETSIGRKGHEELVGTRFHSWSRLHWRLFSLDNSFSRLDSCRLGGSGGNASLGLLHLLHPFLEVLLRVGFGMLLKRFIKPFGFALDSLVSITSPTSLMRAVVGAIIRNFSGSITISPALCAVYALPLIRGRCFIRVGTRLVLVPRLRLVSIRSVSRSVIVVAIFVSGERVKVSRRAISSSFAVIAVSGLAPAVTEVASHTSMEALSAFVAKTLARLHRTPTVRFTLSSITATEAIAVATFAEPIVF
jgi:hypothetical protein